jgi:hypothetical protein
MAAVLACGPDAALSHRSAAHLRGFVRRSNAPEVTVPRKIAKRFGFTAHVFPLTAADSTAVDAIPCTSPSLTLLSLAATAQDDLPGALAQAAKRHALNFAAIGELLARRPRTPGAPALRDALGAYRVEWEWTAAGSRLISAGPIVG